MLVAKLFDERLNIEFFAQSGIQLANANLDLGAKLRECVNSLEQFAAKLLLCSFRQISGLRHGKFQRSTHRRFLPCTASKRTVSCAGSPSSAKMASIGVWRGCQSMTLRAG
jgi:hypothetical protein